MGGKGYEKNAPASVRTMGTQDRGRHEDFYVLVLQPHFQIH